MRDGTEFRRDRDGLNVNVQPRIGGPINGYYPFIHFITPYMCDIYHTFTLIDSPLSTLLPVRLFLTAVRQTGTSVASLIWVHWMAIT